MEDKDEIEEENFTERKYRPVREYERNLEV